MNTADNNVQPPGTAMRSQLDFPVVGIGASAGGIQALLSFFQHMPENPGMAFVVVLHLSPEHESLAPAIFQQATALPVLQVTQTVRVEANHIYVIAPNEQLLMHDGCLTVKELPRPRGAQVAIDLFLRTLAEAHRERAIGIVLSGAGSDGVNGMRYIKEHGGIAIVQSPEDAEYDSMPRSVIQAGVADIVLSAADIPLRLQNLKHAPLLTSNPVLLNDDEVPDPGFDDERQTRRTLHDITVLLRDRTGHDFTHYKRATILRRIERRMHVHGLNDLPAYSTFLREHTEETPLLLEDLLISVTNFFRDPEAFEALEGIVPQLFEHADQDNAVRAWSVACATGEEAYSLAILLLEHAATRSTPTPIQIFASDIDEQAIAVARHGLYPRSIELDVSSSRLQEFFVEEQNNYRVNKNTREKILFAAHNILRDPPFSKLDLICCRNLLIYLERDIQIKVFEMFHYALQPGGYLFLGSAESAEMVSQYFQPVDKKNRIFRATLAPRSGRYIPPLPFGSRNPERYVKPMTLPGKTSTSYSELHLRLLEKYAPPSVLVDEKADIIHSTESATRFLRFVGGAPSHSLLQCVHPELRQELHVAVFQAARQREPSETRFVAFDVNERRQVVRAIVRPVSDESTAMNLLLITFEEREVEAVDLQRAAEASCPTLVEQLENELKLTRSQLQNTIEQYETSSEELKASNEELQAINEELRSATEELETSKEELQSINEELITVNYELKTKVDETSMVNDDLQNFISATDIATIFVDRGMRIKRFTPPAVNLFNLINSDIGRPLLDITHRLNYPLMADDARLAFERLQIMEREVPGDRGQWYLARMLPYRTVEDRIDGLVLTFIDISSRRRAEQQLRAGEERMRLIVDSTRDYAILTQSLDGLITSWNAGAERIFGYSEHEMLGRPGDLLFTEEDRAASTPEHEMREAREHGRSEDERWHVRKDGSRVFCSGIMSPLRDGELCGYVKIARDVTGNKVLEEKQRDLLLREMATRVAAEEGTRLRDEFFSVLSHELKQPLNLIQLNALLLQRLPDGPRQSREIDRIARLILRTVAGQARIIDDLLDLSRIQTGKLALELDDVEWGPIIERSIDIVSSDAAARNIRINVDLDCGAVPLRADPVRLEQIGWNLLTNAIKFTPGDGEVHVALQREAHEAVLSVRDSGKGISADFLPHVFDMFRQAENGPPRQKGGLGIGLALVRQLVESHGGTVQAFSEGAGRGSEFRVRLPLAPHAQRLPVAPQADAEQVLQGKQVLLVDDSTDILQSFGTLLQLAGAHPHNASSAAEALALARTCSTRFDLIISDIAMPDMDGLALLQALREQTSTARSPAIAVSGMNREQDISAALQAGYAAHLDKPVSLEKLAAILAVLYPVSTDPEPQPPSG